MASGDEIKQITEVMRNINNFKEGIANLDINPRARQYYDIEVFPLNDAFYELENEAGNMGDSAKRLGLVLKKSSIEIEKDLYIGLVDEGKDLFKVLGKKIDVLLKISKET